MRRVRLFALLLALPLLGCTADNPDYASGDPTVDGGPGAPGDVDLAVQQSPADLATTPAPRDLATGGGGQNAPCKSVCDCGPGLLCWDNKCQKPAWGDPPACCEAPNCPQFQGCQHRDGRWDRCGNGGGGGGGGQTPDMSMNGGMGPFWCQFIPCENDQLCKTSGCGRCDGAKKRCM